MKNALRHTIFFFLACVSVASASAQKGPAPKQVIVEKAVIEDKIAGGMRGQLFGNLNGLKHEIKFLDTPGDVTADVANLFAGDWPFDEKLS